MFLANLESYRVGSVDFPMLMDSVMSELQFRREYAGMLGEMYVTKARARGSGGEGVGRKSLGRRSMNEERNGNGVPEKKRRGPMIAAAAVAALLLAGLFAFLRVPAFHALLHPHPADNTAAAAPERGQVHLRNAPPSSSPINRGNAPSAGWI